MGEDVLEGDLWLDSVTGDVYRATDPWAKDGTWNTWGTALWKVIDDVLMVQPAEGDTGTLGEPVSTYYGQYAPWGLLKNNPSVSSMTSVRSKGAIAMNADSRALFCDCKSLTDLSPISNWNISGVTNMSGMFAGCLSLTDISPISNWDVSGVTNMSGMFSNCDSLTAVPPISGWDVSGVTDMASMFYSCTSLTDLSPLSNWDVSGVTDMFDMFYSCTSLTDISALSGWDVSGVTNMPTTFSSCTSLTDASAISGWDVSNMKDMGSMFDQCPLERIGVPSLAHGGRKFVSMLKYAKAVANMDTTMLTNTTTSETMSANQILTDMDATPSKYAAGTVWTIARA